MTALRLSAFGAIAIIALFQVVGAETMREDLVRGRIDANEAEAAVTTSLALAAITLGLALFLVLTGRKRH